MRTVLFIFIISILSACAGNSNNIKTTAFNSTHSAEQTHNRNNRLIQQKLLAQHSDWRGAPYQYAGLSKNGIDCSGFIYLTFRDQFNLNLPRTTQKQANVGIRVLLKDLTAGDLIFFNTGKKQRHVGIYIADSKFLHVSTQKGVKISSLTNPYWKNNFGFASRIKNLK